MTVIQSLTIKYRQRRFAFLFFTLLITMLSVPMFGALGLGTKFMEIVLGLNILAATLITLHSHRSYVGLGFLALFLAASGGHMLLGHGPFLVTSQGIGASICLVAVFSMLRHILRAGRVDSERIFAALSVYLLIGVICGLLFFIFEESWPGSISFQRLSLAGNNDTKMEHIIYFSFVTLGTLGYGDILPVSGPARALAMTEAIIGQMYLVVIVARLVSLYQSEADRNGRT
jgi:hypothetical protein